MLWLNTSQKKNYIDVFSKIYDRICVHLQDFYIIEMNQWKKIMTYKTIWKLYKHQLSSKNVYLLNMVANIHW